LLGGRVEWRIQGMALDVSFRTQRFGKAADEWTVVFEPVFSEFFDAQFGTTADTINEF
jgi:hypothetical protein